MKIINTVSVALILLVCITSCKKYEDGPSFSLLTKKARLCNDWKVTEYSVNGVAQNLSSGAIYLSIKKDGTYTSIYSLGSLSVNNDGKWEFSDDKEQVTFTSSSTGAMPETSDILELKNNALKLKHGKSGIITIQSLEPK